MFRSVLNLSFMSAFFVLLASSFSLDVFADSPRKVVTHGGGAWNFEYSRQINTPEVARLLSFIAHTSLTMEGLCDSTFVQNFIFRLAIPGDSSIQEIWSNFNKSEFSVDQVKCVENSLAVVKGTQTSERVGISE